MGGAAAARAAQRCQRLALRLCNSCAAAVAPKPPRLFGSARTPPERGALSSSLPEALAGSVEEEVLGLPGEQVRASGAREDAGRLRV